MDTQAIDLRSEVKSHLFLEVLRSFGEARLAVTGTSMLPAIWPGDIVEVRRQSAAEIFPGQVVLLERHGCLVAHRVVEKVSGMGRTILVTHGDRLQGPDATVSSEEVLGCVTAVLRGNRRSLPQMTLGCRVASWVLCRSELATRVLLRLGALRHNSPLGEKLWTS
jgi:signal peptidase I